VRRTEVITNVTQISATRGQRTAALLLAGALALCGALLWSGLVADQASAQSAFCQQYPDDPDCQGDTGPTGGGDEGLLPDFGGGLPGGTADADGVDRGELPFTGYPLTALILLMLLLLLLGATVRMGLAARDRMRARNAVAQAKAAA
jgi:hypothetical protein